MPKLTREEFEDANAKRVALLERKADGPLLNLEEAELLRLTAAVDEYVATNFPLPPLDPDSNKLAMNIRNLVNCPMCGALRGEPCRDFGSGFALAYNHRARVDAYASGLT